MAFDVVTSCSCVRLHDISDSSSSNRTPRIVALIPQKSLGRALTVAGFLFIAALTLSPQYGTVKAPPSFCVLCGGSSVLDAILNVLLFIPLGVGLRLSGMSRRRAFAIGLVTTITVELLQLWIPGRDTSLGDIFTNSFGGFVGIICADIWRVVILPSRREAARIASAWVIVWLAILAASAELAHISLPHTSSWGVWAPELLHHDYFPGTVHGATAGGLPTPNAIAATSDDVRRRLSSDSVVVRADITGGSATTAMAAIATVYDWQKSQIFLLGERKGNLTFSLRMRTADVRISTPAIRLDSVFKHPRRSSRDTISVAGGLVDHRLWVSAESDGVRRERTLPVDAGLGWSYLLPFDYEYGAEAPWLTAMWLAALAAPGAYWAVRAGARVLLAVAAVMAAGLLAIPWLASVHATPWWEWLALMAGLLAGAVLGAAIVRASRPLSAGYGAPITLP
jgi:VanZ family protein